MVEFYFFTLSATDTRIKILLFDKNRTHDFRTSRCASYLLDHSGDEGCMYMSEDAYVWSALSEEYGSIAMVANPACGQLDRGNGFSLSPFASEKLV